MATWIKWGVIGVVGAVVAAGLGWWALGPELLDFCKFATVAGIGLIGFPLLCGWAGEKVISQSPKTGFYLGFFLGPILTYTLVFWWATTIRAHLVANRAEQAVQTLENSYR